MGEGVIWGLHKRGIDGKLVYCPLGVNFAPQWIIPEGEKKNFLLFVKVMLLFTIVSCLTLFPILRIYRDNFGFFSGFSVVLLLITFYIAGIYYAGMRYGEKILPGSFSSDEINSAARNSKEHGKFLIKRGLEVLVVGMSIVLLIALYVNFLK